MEVAMKEIEKEMTAMKTELELLFSQRDSIMEKIMICSTKFVAAKEKKFNLMLSQGMIDWNYLLDMNNETQRIYAECISRLRAIGLGSGGYNPKTNQRSIRIALTKGDPKSLEQTLTGLGEVIPFILPTKEGAKEISIFEHTLSRHAIYNLLIFNDKIELIELSYRNSVLKTFTDLRTALSYIQERHYYDKARKKR